MKWLYPRASVATDDKGEDRWSARTAEGWWHGDARERASALHRRLGECGRESYRGPNGKRVKDTRQARHNRTPQNSKI